MNAIRRLLAAALLLSSPFAARALDLKVEDAWIRAAPPGAMMLAGYARIGNAGSEPVRITTAGSSGFGVVEIHETVEVDGVSRMRPVPVLEIAPGGTAVLQPGGMHLMLMQPRQPLKDGDTVVIDLIDDAGTPAPAVFTVRRAD